MGSSSASARPGATACSSWQRTGGAGSCPACVVDGGSVRRSRRPEVRRVRGRARAVRCGPRAGQLIAMLDRARRGSRAVKGTRCKRAALPSQVRILPPPLSGFAEAATASVIAVCIRVTALRNVQERLRIERLSELAARSRWTPGQRRCRSICAPGRHPSTRRCPMAPLAPETGAARDRTISPSSA